ncbi:hypothetical protein Sgleb_48590 [Streptomyces glebosus]|uniref:Uncharacterized protein n=1 Tax=Streptomyces glebosus TaxID=249580 RepID=A0A640T181_9ACTN|nr:hypothetical protein Sgleb_48590 [Streptomyces glebosus]GHG82025.1 hypothetical protein GCM10010513_60960 [Streptomyces glebosus]
MWGEGEGWEEWGGVHGVGPFGGTGVGAATRWLGGGRDGPVGVDGRDPGEGGGGGRPPHRYSAGRSMSSTATCSPVVWARTPASHTAAAA